MKRLRSQWTHPNLPRYYVCAGVSTLAAVLDQTTEERVAYFDSWGDANREAERLNSEAGPDGVKIIPGPDLSEDPAKFVAVGRAVMSGAECLGVMRSHTFAKRTANALNNHKPNGEGV